jgi:hypothetical protein
VAAHIVFIDALSVFAVYLYGYIVKCQLFISACFIVPDSCVRCVQLPFHVPI